MASGTYKSYSIENDSGYITIYSENGAIAGQGYENVIEAMLYIDRNFKEPVSDRQDAELLAKLDFAYQSGYNIGASKAYREGYRDGGRAAANDIYEAK